MAHCNPLMPNPSFTHTHTHTLYQCTWRGPAWALLDSMSQDGEQVLRRCHFRSTEWCTCNVPFLLQNNVSAVGSAILLWKLFTRLPCVSSLVLVMFLILFWKLLDRAPKVIYLESWEPEKQSILFMLHLCLSVQSNAKLLEHCLWHWIE